MTQKTKHKKKKNFETDTKNNKSPSIQGETNVHWSHHLCMGICLSSGSRAEVAANRWSARERDCWLRLRLYICFRRLNSVPRGFPFLDDLAEELIFMSAMRELCNFFSNTTSSSWTLYWFSSSSVCWEMLSPLLFSLDLLVSPVLLVSPCLVWEVWLQAPGLVLACRRDWLLFRAGIQSTNNWMIDRCSFISSCWLWTPANTDFDYALNLTSLLFSLLWFLLINKP